MKLLTEVEDCIVGIAVGVLIILFSGKFGTFSWAKTALLVGAIIFTIFCVLDLIHSFHDFSGHPLAMILSPIHSIIDLALMSAFISIIFGFNLPVISVYVVPLLSSAGNIFLAGLFVTLTNALWIIFLPKL